MKRYKCLVLLILLFACKAKPKPESSLIGKWKIVSSYYNDSMEQRYFHFDSSTFSYIRTIKEVKPYTRQGDTVFSIKTGMNEVDTSIIVLISPDTAEIRNRHGGENYFIIRVKD